MVLPNMICCFLRPIFVLTMYFKYAYCPVNVSRAVGPRNVDRAINDLSNDYFIKDLQFPTMLNFLRLLVFEIISCDLSDSSDWPIHSHEHLPCERTLRSHWTTS